MRNMFGLAGILVTVGVVAWILNSAYLPHTQAVITAQKSMQPTINRIASQGDDGVPVAKSAVLVPIETNGKLRGLSVQSIVQGGGLQTVYGLMPGDVIRRINGFVIGESGNASVEDESSAKDFLCVDAYRGHWPLTVDRAGTEISLPSQRSFSPPPAANNSGKTTPAQ